jgi:cytochrome c oxidase subunit 3
VQWAVSAARHDEQPGIRHGLLATFVLGVAFLVSQTVNWFVLVAAAFTPKANLYAFTYYLLTGLHALHVLGGLVPVGVVTARAFRGDYSAARHSGVEYAAMYWHFLDVVWVVLFIVLYLAG